MNKQSLIEAVQRKAESSPYVIKENANGFTLSLNIVDEKWYTILQKNGINKAFIIECKVNEANKKVMTSDTIREINWRAGGMQPTLGGKISTMKGEINEVGFRKDLGVSEQGKVGKVFDYTYDTPEAKKWLSETLTENGYEKDIGSTAKIGIIIAVAAVVLFILPLLLLPLLLIVIL